MAENANPTTLEQLKDKVHNGLDVISDDELAMLFEEAEKLTPSTPTSTAQTTPSKAPVSAEVTPPVTETPQGQASLLNKAPDKFKGKDEAATLDNILKALQDTEVALTQSNQERSQLQGLVSELSRKPKEEYRPIQTPPVQSQVSSEDAELDNLDDATFFDKASDVIKKVREEAKKVAREESLKAVQHYDTFATRRDTLSRFKVDHPDFDNFRQEVMEVCRIHPEWDNDLNGLPRIYEAAKALAIAKAQSFKPQSMTTQGIDVEKLKAEIRAEVEASSIDKARQAIKEEVMRRKAASGILSSRDANVSLDRSLGGAKTTPLTQEERVLDDMMKSGPKTLGI